MGSITLSEKEKEYLKDPEKFEDEHSLKYARKYRHRIREKMSRALDLLLSVLEKEKTRRSAGKEYVRREREQEDEAVLRENLPQKRQEKELVDFSKVIEIVKKVSRRGKLKAGLLKRITEEAYEEQR